MNGFLFQLRGNAGSHDLPFSVETLTALNKLTKDGVLFSSLIFPWHDSLFVHSAYSGRGDRADPSVWPEVEGPLTVRESSARAGKQWGSVCLDLD
ncbi:hypothetical protein PTKIN_Ptkin18bG0051500 [Pterospermum kingtungense]